jgi:hypothetical protein
MKELINSRRRIAMRIFALAAIFVGCISLAAVGGKAENKHYFVFFMKAETYRQMPPEIRQVYLSGWLDARLNAGLTGENHEAISAQRECVQGKSINQITAIVDKYIEGHPETWDHPAATEADDALQMLACPELHQVMGNMLLKQTTRSAKRGKGRKLGYSVVAARKDLTIVLTTGLSSGRTSSSAPALARIQILSTTHSEESAFQISICL